MKLLAVALGLVLTACALEDEGANGETGSGNGGGDPSSSGNGGAGHNGLIWVEGVDAGDAGETGSGANNSTASGREGPSKGGGGAGGGELDCENVAPNHEVLAHTRVDDSNSYASPMLVRELTGDPSWSVGDPLPVRAHEFLNAYGQKITDGLLDADLEQGLHVGADARVHEALDFEGRRLIELAVTFSSFDASTVAVPDVTFVMDTAASMGGEGIERLHGVLRGAGSKLSSTPRSVAALTTLGGGTVVREMSPWSGPDDAEALIAAATGVTDDDDLDATLQDALEIARQQASRSLAPGVVMVVTDGTDSLSDDTVDEIALERGMWPPVRVVGVGVGPARAYVDDLLNRATNESGGAYFYAPSREAAESELEARFSSLTQVAARNVQLQLGMPSSMRVVGVAGGTPTDLGGGEGQNLGADSTMIFHIYISAPADLVCPTLGLAIEWDDPGENAEHHVFPGADAPATVPLFERFDGAPPSEAYRRIEAIVAAADAMRGPTRERLDDAVGVFNDFLRSTVPDDSAAALCTPLARFCAAPGASCLACPSD